MSKTLTEQWKDGTLEESMYYVKLPDNDIPIVNLYQLKQLALVNDADKIEVLAKVPTYDQFVELTKNVDELTAKYNQLKKKVKKRGIQINKAYDRYVAKRKENSKMVTKCNRLEEQLKEAETIIQLYFKDTQNITYKSLGMNDGYYKKAFIHAIAKDYIEKWGVK